ncbi:MAG: hypothetical protein A2W98_03285 [Bacteroidetes bacterium GWF2_33_38]|nr:MAG: hypothetical protein A2W98_03285 [Bacteroidetes bacterium GWF2_33_38]OFY72872.1 MAG: hypothetical protein A2265_04180 [Bacteroidetes bacterium RIFOXYA12_FULL_33_9]OFY91934.1 MAG: hypothetical protein A2236_02035 [Bacteroidetes bacterium RIFOXYA2_FULL_33_7]
MLDGFSFCIFDSVRDKFIALYHKQLNVNNMSIEDYCKELNSFIENEDVLFQRKYKKVKVLYYTEKFTFVPTPLFDKNNLNKYISLNFDTNNTERLMINELHNAEAVNIFSVSEKKIQLLEAYFANVKIYHQSLPVVETSLVTYKNKTKVFKVIVDVHDNSFDLLVIKGRKLILFNTFSYSTDDDFSYFILLVYEQLKLNPEETEIIFMGNIHKKDEKFIKIKKYIRHIKHEKLDEGFLYSYTFFDIPAYKFSNLLSLQKCE